MLKIPIKPGLPGGQWACLRPLCGHDEARIDGTGSLEATSFLEKLLVETPGTSVSPDKAWDLAITDRDRLLAELYRQYFGDTIESVIGCPNCQKRFDLKFSLNALMNDLTTEQATDARGPDKDGHYTLEDGRRFRLPTSADQRSVFGLEPKQAITQLLEGCMIEGDPHTNPKPLQDALDTAGPILDTDLLATCPECETSQHVRFTIHSYLLGVLAHEKRFLTREIHLIAMAYGWSLHDILTLSRDDRRTYVQLIESDQHARRKGRL